MKRAFLLIAIVFIVGCVRVEYLEYRGIQAWPTGSAFVQKVEGVDVYEGLPNRTYEVILVQEEPPQQPVAGQVEVGSDAGSSENDTAE